MDLISGSNASVFFAAPSAAVQARDAGTAIFTYGLGTDGETDGALMALAEDAGGAHFPISSEGGAAGAEEVSGLLATPAST